MTTASRSGGDWAGFHAECLWIFLLNLPRKCLLLPTPSCPKSSGLDLGNCLFMGFSASLSSRTLPSTQQASLMVNVGLGAYWLPSALRVKQELP